MDKTLRYFWSGQTKDSSTLSQNTSNKDLKQINATNGFQDAEGINTGKHMQNPTIDIKRKDSDSFFYILEFFKFLTNDWMLSGAIIAFICIIFANTMAACFEKPLPAALEWVFSMILIESLVIALSMLVSQAGSFLLYNLLFIIASFMAVLTMAGVHVLKDRQNYFRENLTFYMLVVFSLNMLFLALSFTLAIIANMNVKWYSRLIFIGAAIAYPILILNILYVSMLIGNDLYEIKTLTGCLKPAMYLYGIFASLLWLTLSLAIEICKLK